MSNASIKKINNKLRETENSVKKEISSKGKPGNKSKNNDDSLFNKFTNISDSFKKTILGSNKKKCTDSEQRAKLYARRSIVSNKSIKKGTVFDDKNLISKRPGTGISPSEMQSIIGKRASRDIAEDEILSFDDIY